MYKGNVNPLPGEVVFLVLNKLSYKVLLMGAQLTIGRSLTQETFPLALLKTTLLFAQSQLFIQARRINLTMQNALRN